jgi:hypothetical protein
VSFVDFVILPQRFLETSSSGVDPCKLWRHWGAGWVSFILVIFSFVRGEYNLLTGEASSESMGVANTCGWLGEKQSQQSSTKVESLKANETDCQDVGECKRKHPLNLL